MGNEIINIDEQLRQLQVAGEIVGLIDKLLRDRPEMFKRTAVYDMVRRYLKRDEIAISITYKLGDNEGVYNIDIPGKKGTTVFCAEKVNGDIVSACVISDIGLKELKKLFDD